MRTQFDEFFFGKKLVIFFLLHNNNSSKIRLSFTRQSAAYQSNIKTSSNEHLALLTSQCAKICKKTHLQNYTMTHLPISTILINQIVQQN